MVSCVDAFVAGYGYRLNPAPNGDLD